MTSSSSSSRRQRRRPVRPMQQRPGRRPTKREEKTIDYEREYDFVRHDLRRIALWSVLLFAGMFVAYFFV